MRTCSDPGEQVALRSVSLVGDDGNTATLEGKAWQISGHWNWLSCFCGCRQQSLCASSAAGTGTAAWAQGIGVIYATHVKNSARKAPVIPNSDRRLDIGSIWTCRHAMAK